MSFIGRNKYKVRARVSPRKRRKLGMPVKLEDVFDKGRGKWAFQLKEDDVLWKKVIKLCESKGYGHPSNLNRNAVHFPDWTTYGLPFDQDGKTTLQECVDSSETANIDVSREPSDDLVRGS